MNIQFTDEQWKILLENENFRKELINSLVYMMLKEPWCNPYYSELLEIVSKELPQGLIENHLSQDVNLKLQIDEKVEQIIEKFVSRSIGEIVLKSLKDNKRI